MYFALSIYHVVSIYLTIHVYVCIYSTAQKYVNSEQKLLFFYRTLYPEDKYSKISFGFNNWEHSFGHFKDSIFCSLFTNFWAALYTVYTI